jgi:hypothetical protein
MIEIIKEIILQFVWIGLDDIDVGRYPTRKRVCADIFKSSGATRVKQVAKESQDKTTWGGHLSVSLDVNSLLERTQDTFCETRF